MRSKDIQIGQEYDIGWKLTGKALEVGVETRSWSGAVQKNGIRFLVTSENRRGEEIVIPSRMVQHSVEEGAKLRAYLGQREQRRQELNQERGELVEEYSNRLEELGLSAERISYSWVQDIDKQDEDFEIDIRISSKTFESILDLIGAPEASVEPGSALGKLFGSTE